MAAAGSLDTTFDTIIKGANGQVYSIAVQSDGKVLIGGSFTTYNGTSRNRIARLNANGSLDTSFDVGTGTTNTVSSIAIQSDGKILIGGFFSTYNGTSRSNIARLNADGSLDTSFVVGTGADGTVESIVLQSNGKILIGGGLTTYNGQVRNRIARLNADGSLDTSFTGGNGANNLVQSMAIQSDGKIVIGGVFTTYSGTAINRIARLNTDGSLDTTFTVGTGADSAVRSIAIQSDGKVLIGGEFTSYNGFARNRIARLNANGALDTSFTVGTGASSFVLSIIIQSDGKIVIGGWFTTYNGTSRSRIARLNADGSLDTSFLNIGTGANSDVNALAIQSDGKILIGGYFTTYNGTARTYIARLNTDGSLDTSFLNSNNANNLLFSIAIQSDGKIVIGGGFTRYDGTSINRIARINADASLDTSFNVGTGANGSVQSIAVQSDGKILIGGSFTTYNGTSRNNIARLNANGSLDTSFTVGTGANAAVWSIAIQSDGKILIGGVFTTYNGTTINRIARLYADGSLDTTFTVGTGASSTVTSIAVQSDGKVLIGGGFSAYNGTGRNYIARLNANGSVDTTFLNVGSGANGSVASIVVQSDGKIVIGGSFTTYNGTSRNNIARLNANGSLDTTFLNAGTGANGRVLSIAIQSDGKILSGGDFTTYNGTSRNRITRLNADGSLDTTFTVGSGANVLVYSVVVQSDGKVLIGGEFTTYNGIGSPYIARLTAGTIPGAPTAVTATAGSSQASVSWTAPASDGGSAITSYTVTSSPGGFTATTANGSTRTAVVTGLTAGTAYTFTVRATNAVGTGTASSASNSVTPYTTPGAPTTVAATAGSNQASVSWTAPVSNGGSAITSYTVTSSPGGFTATTGTTTATVTGLVVGTVYTFTVRASNAGGLGAVSSVSNSVTPYTTPGAPTGVAATAGSSQASVSWTAPASDGGSGIISYTVTSSPGGFTATTGTTTATVTGLVVGTVYTFTVRASNAGGLGTASSASNSVTPYTTPDAPTDVAATAGSSQASVSWTAPASDGGSAITSYTVTSTPGGFTATTTDGSTTTATVTGLTAGTAYTFTVSASNAGGLGTASSDSNSVTPYTTPDAPTDVAATAGSNQASVSWTAPASDGGSPVTSYTVTSTPGGFTATTADGSTTTATVTGLATGTAYTFTVTATNDVGTGSASSPSNSVTPYTTPGAPTDVIAIADHKRATVSWTAPASNGFSPITLYTVTSSPGGFTATSATTTAIVAGLTNGITYTFTVTATNAAGISSASSASAAVTPVSAFVITGSMDTTFDTITKGADKQVRSIEIQNDGKVLIGGDFTSYSGTARNRIARLNANGTLDTTFTVGTGANSLVFSIAIQSDGKILIGGLFTTYNGTARNYIARLNADGSLDTTFDVGTGANNQVRSIAIQSDGKILIGGLFTAYNGTSRNYIARLNADGSLDTSFLNVGTGANNWVLSIVVQSDGKIIIGGGFTTYNGTTINRIARLNADGSLDATFDVGAGINGSVTSVAIQSDGKILIGGDFSTYNGTARNYIARLNANGSLDTAFNNGTGPNNGLYSIRIQSDGKILIGGTFTTYNGPSRLRIARLNADGTLDTSFTVGTSTGPVNSIAVQSNGKVLIGGEYRIAWLNADGSLDASVNVETGANGRVRSIAIQNNGKILIGGDFTSYNGTARNSIVRANPDGYIDTTFTVGTGANSYINDIGVQSDGKIVIGGAFTSYNGTSRNYIARLNADGSLDTSFDVGTGASTTVNSIAIQSDGKILVGGFFTSYNGTARNYIARLNANGSLDTTFTVGAGANAAVWSIAIQSDGKILIGGFFTTYNGTTRNRIARLNADGSIDTTFLNIGSGANNYVYSIRIQSNAKILIGGGFTTYNGTSRSRIARLNADGSLDTSFLNIGTGANSDVNALAIQSDGKILIGGYFTTYNGTARTYIARLNTDGSLDTRFNIGTGANNTPRSIIVQTNGDIIIGGDFTRYNSIPVSYIVGVIGVGSTTPDAPTSVTATVGDKQATVSWTAPASDGGSVITSYTVTSSPGGFTATTVNGSTTTAIVTGLANSTAYTFTVTATNAAGTSDASAASAAVTPGGAPGTPTGITATPTGPGEVTVSWTPPTNTGGTPITSYTVSSNTGGYTATVAGDQTTAVVTGIETGTSYTFSVVAANAVSPGSASTPSSSVFLITSPIGPVAVGLNASARVTWTLTPGDRSANTGYTVTSTPGSFTSTVSGANTAEATLTGLTNGVSYTFRVVANTTSYGSSPVSVVTNAIIPSTTNIIIAIDESSTSTTSVSEYVATQGARPASDVLLEAKGGVVTEQSNLSLEQRTSVTAQYIESLRTTFNTDTITVASVKSLGTTFTSRSEALVEAPVVVFLPAYVAETATVDLTNFNRDNKYVQIELPPTYSVVLMEGPVSKTLTYDGTTIAIDGVPIGIDGKFRIGTMYEYTLAGIGSFLILAIPIVRTITGNGGMRIIAHRVRMF